MIRFPKIGRVFSSPEALKRYLQEHPKADPSKHSVRGKPKGDKPKGDKPKDDKGKDDKPKDDKGEGESKGDGGKPEKGALDSAIDEAIHTFLRQKNLTEGQKKRVLEQAISDSETESKGKARKLVRDFSKEEGFESLEGLSSAEQRKVIERALKMANQRIASQAQKLALTDPKAAYDLLDQAYFPTDKTARLRVLDLSDGYAVEDTDGGIWWPDDDAQEEIAESRDPERSALQMAQRQPRRGIWKDAAVQAETLASSNPKAAYDLLDQAYLSTNNAAKVARSVPDIDVEFVTPRSNQGQMIEVSYSFSADDDGYLYKKVLNRGSGKVTYYQVHAEDVRGKWEPWNREPKARFRKLAGFSQKTMRAHFEEFTYEVLSTVYEYVAMLHRRISRQERFQDVPGFTNWDMSQSIRGSGNEAEGRVWLKGGLAMDNGMDGTINVKLTLVGDGVQLEALDYRTSLVSRRFKLTNTASGIGMAVGEAWERKLTGSVDYGD